MWFGLVDQRGRARRRAARAAIRPTPLLTSGAPARTRTALALSLAGATALMLVESMATGAVATHAFLAGPVASGRLAAEAAVEVAAAVVPPDAHLPEVQLQSLAPPPLPPLPVLAPPIVAPKPAPLAKPASVPAPAAPVLAAPAPALTRTPMDHLPHWVQTKQPAGLLSGPDTAAVRFTTLPAWTFLKVVGVEADRLQVEYAGDGGPRKPGPGWVALDDVQPSDASGDWLRNHRASQLFDGPADSAEQVASVPQWSFMLTLGGPAAERVHVRVYSTDFKRVLGEGWLAASDVGPAGPPDRAVNTQRLDAPASPFASHDAFIDVLGKAARESQATTGVPASVTVAQAILESDWGDSLLSRAANNYFGIKAMGQVGNDGAIWMRTMEYDANGAAYYTLAPFRAYKSLVDGVTDHSQLFRRVSLYRSAMQATDNPNEFARRIAAAGYSTDPAYPSKLIGLMQRYNLYRFDQPRA